MSSPNILAAVVANLRTTLLAADADGHVTMANAAMCALVSQPEWQCLGRNASELFGNSEVLRRCLRDLEPGAERRLTISLEHEGAYTDVGLSVQRLVSAEPNVVFIVTGRDLGILGREEERARHLSVLAALDGLATGFVERLRDPLATISLLAESLKIAKRETDHDAPDRIQALVERMDAVLDQLSLVAGGSSNRVEVVAVQSLVDRSMNGRAASAAWSAAPTMSVSAAGDVLVDPAQIAEALRALIDAAIAAGGQPDVVCVDVVESPVTRRDGTVERFVAFDVSFVGRALSDADAASALQEFRASSGSDGAYRLAIAQLLALRNGGTVTARSAAGRGTTFRLLLPVAASGDSAR